MSKLLTATAAALMLATPVLAAESAVTTEASKVQAGTYDVEPNHTQVLFSVNHLGFTVYTGVFTKASGTLVLDPRSRMRASSTCRSTRPACSRQARS